MSGLSIDFGRVMEHNCNRVHDIEGGIHIAHALILLQKCNVPCKLSVDCGIGTNMMRGIYTVQNVIGYRYSVSSDICILHFDILTLVALDCM